MNLKFVDDPSAARPAGWDLGQPYLVRNAEYRSRLRLSALDALVCNLEYLVLDRAGHRSVTTGGVTCSGS